MGAYLIFVTGLLGLYEAARPPPSANSAAWQVAIGPHPASQQQVTTLAEGDSEETSALLTLRARAEDEADAPMAAAPTTASSVPMDWYSSAQTWAKYRDAAGNYMDKDDLKAAAEANFTDIRSGDLELATPSRPLENPDRYKADLETLKNELDPAGKVFKVLDQDEKAAKVARGGINDWLKGATDERMRGNLEYHKSVANLMKGLEKEKKIFFDTMGPHVKSSWTHQQAATSATSKK